MKLTEFLETHELRFLVKYSVYNHQWYGTIDDLYIQTGRVVTGVTGHHKDSVIDAMLSVIDIIKGEKLVYKALSRASRREIRAPMDIEL